MKLYKELDLFHKNNLKNNILQAIGTPLLAFNHKQRADMSIAEWELWSRIGKSQEFKDACDVYIASLLNNNSIDELNLFIKCFDALDKNNLWTLANKLTRVNLLKMYIIDIIKEEITNYGVEL